MSASQQAPTPRDRFDEYLRSNHKRRTPERFAILEQVMKAPGHLSAEELCELMRADGYPVSAATVYSTLELLVDCGLVARQRFADKACLYEKITVHAAHHHLICTSCGKIKEVRDPVVSAHVETSRFAGFTQSYYTLNIYGTCGACLRKRRRAAKSKQ